MFLSHSTGRKVLVTAIAIVLFAGVYEVTFLDSRFAARQADQELTASPALGARLRFTATGYCRGTTTASGVNVRSGIAAADPDLLPVGSVVQIDSFPPYRRPLGRDVWPAPRGKVNLGQTIWMRWGEARERLAALGVMGDKPEVIQLPRSFRELVRKLGSRLFAAPGAIDHPPLPRLIEEGLGLPPSGRVVAFGLSHKPEEDAIPEDLVPEEEAAGEAGAGRELDADRDREPLGDTGPDVSGPRRPDREQPDPERPRPERPDRERPGPESPGGAGSVPGGIET